MRASHDWSREKAKREEDNFGQALNDIQVLYVCNNSLSNVPILSSSYFCINFDFPINFFIKIINEKYQDFSNNIFDHTILYIWRFYHFINYIWVTYLSFECTEPINLRILVFPTMFNLNCWYSSIFWINLWLFMLLFLMLYIWYNKNKNKNNSRMTFL